jgi:hypothetical protein
MCRVDTNEHYSCASVSNKDTSESNIRKWVSFTENMLDCCLEESVYSIDFKQKYFYQLIGIHYH